MDTNDRFHNASTTSSSSNDLSHTLDIIKAAFPYLDSQTQQSLDLVIKTGELFETFHALKQEDNVTALSVRKQSVDIEALLNGIRSVCNQKEKDLIDMILNFFKAKNLYNTYATLASVMASQTENTDNCESTDNPDSMNQSDNNSSNSNNNNFASMFGMSGNPNMKEVLETFLTPEQKSTFDNINMMFSVMQ